VAGAWEELIDRYAELGYEVPKKSTRLVAASSLEQQVGAQPVRLRALAATTDEAVFSGTEVNPGRSETVWTEALAAAALAQAAVTRSRRLISRYRISKVRRQASTKSTNRGSTS
jgi:hypothetical protein